MSLAAGPIVKDNESNHSAEAATPDQSDHEQPIVKLPDDPIARADRVGTSVPVVAVEHTVKVAEEVEPELAKEAQADLDLKAKNGLKAQILAAKNAAVQQERKSDDVKRSEAELQAAKALLRTQKGASHPETAEDHSARLAKEEKDRLAALKQAPVLEGQLAREAAEKIAPKLAKIHEDAANAQAQRAAALADEQRSAEEARKQNEAHQQEQEKKAKAAEEQARTDSTRFTGSSPIGPKLTPELLEKLNAAKGELTGVKGKVDAYEQALMIETAKAPVEVAAKDLTKPSAVLALFEARRKAVADEAAARQAEEAAAVVAAEPEAKKPPRRGTRVKAAVQKYGF